MRNAVRTITLGTSLLALVACTEGSGPSKQTMGTVGGAAAGAAAGYFIGGKSAWGAVIGGVAGGLVGNYIGAQLDESDRQQAADAAERAMAAPVGQRQTWSNPQSGNSGDVRTVRQTTQAGRLCRDFETTVRTSGGQSETGRGTACQNADGSWTII